MIRWASRSRATARKEATYPLACYVCDAIIASDREGLCRSLELPGRREVQPHSRPRCVQDPLIGDGKDVSILTQHHPAVFFVRRIVARDLGILSEGPGMLLGQELVGHGEKCPGLLGEEGVGTYEKQGVAEANGYKCPWLDPWLWTKVG